MESLRKHLPVSLLTAAFLSVFVPIFVPAQSAQEPAGPTVRLSLIATDRSKHSLDGLNKESISILEDKIPQSISLFAKDERPVDYGLVIDNTGSFRNLLNAAVETAQFLVSNNRDNDETFIERFISSNKIQTVQEFTADKTELVKSLRTLYVEGGQSAVIDGVYEAAKHISDYRAGTKERRKALVLISDGEDRASYYSDNQLMQLLREKEVQVFVIGIVTQLEVRPGAPTGLDPRGKAEKLLTLMARETGGRAFFPRTTDELRHAASEIVHDLRAQYLIGYQSTTPNSKENFRKVEVTIAEAPGGDRPSAITRPGFFVNPPSSTAKEKDKKKSKG